MANVYDSITREQALQHRHFCDPKSADIISSLVEYLDRNNAAETQRTISDLLLRAQAAEAGRDKVKYELAEARAELDRIYEKDAMDSIERLRKEAK